MDEIIAESEVAVEVGAEVGVRTDSPFVHLGVIAWPTSSTPRASHVTW